MASSLQQYYNNKAPRWLRVIRWRNHFTNFAKKQKFYSMTIYPMLLFMYWWPFSPYEHRLFILRPQTEEERLLIKQKWNGDTLFDRNVNIDEYLNDLQPRWDMRLRRQKYPEHYGNRYDKPEKLFDPIC